MWYFHVRLTRANAAGAVAIWVLRADMAILHDASGTVFSDYQGPAPFGKVLRVRSVVFLGLAEAIYCVGLQ